MTELGGKFVGPGHDELYRLAAELGVQTFPTYGSGGAMGSTERRHLVRPS